MDSAGANATTLASYAQGIERYREAGGDVIGGSQQTFLEEVVARVPPGGAVLEIGSATGRDAAWLEARGLSVRRTDGCAAFVEALKVRGHDAEVLNVLADPVPGGFDLVYASAVLLHVGAVDLAPVLTKLCWAAPLLSFSVKEGQGAEWSTAKMNLPRFFQYWSEASLREVLAQTPWEVEAIARRTGRQDDWLHVHCRRV